MNIQKLIKESFNQIFTESYNGYPNYPTYLIVSSLVNSEIDIQHWGEQANDVWNDVVTRFSDIEEAKQAAIINLASLMKEYFLESPEVNGSDSELNNELVKFALGSVVWERVAAKFLTDDVIAAASEMGPEDAMGIKGDEVIGTPADASIKKQASSKDFSAVSLNENEIPIDAEYMMVSVKGTGKDEQFGVFVIPRTLKTYFQDPIKFVNSIVNERGKYSFVKYVKDPKDPNLTPKPHFIQTVQAFKLSTTELNPQHDPASPEAQTQVAQKQQ